jgi:hypothetical protein
MIEMTKIGMNASDMKDKDTNGSVGSVLKMNGMNGRCGVGIMRVSENGTIDKREKGNVMIIRCEKLQLV